MGAEEGAEGVEEGEEVGWCAGVGGIESWGEEGGDYEAVDCVGWGCCEGVR